jgi:GDPmannose 4,6-dehydratase
VARALISGITGQDGSYLAELLLDKGYEVHGLVRRVATEDSAQRLSRLAAICDRIRLHPVSLESFASLYTVVAQVQPDELYHLAAQTFVSNSFEDAFSTFRANIDGTHFLLESVRQQAPRCKVYFAASSEMFGNPPEAPQSERTPMVPCSPYGITKLAGFHLARYYRDAYGLFVSSGILFNHESPRRGMEFVTRKVTSQVARIKRGLCRELALGNLDAERDWGYAPDYVRAIHAMLQQQQADDFVVATGQTHSVRQLCELAFGLVGLDYREHVVSRPELFRPIEVRVLKGDASKAHAQFGWTPEYNFQRTIETMVEHDLAMTPKA